MSEETWARLDEELDKAMDSMPEGEHELETIVLDAAAGYGSVDETLQACRPWPALEAALRDHLGIKRDYESGSQPELALAASLPLPS